jgi:hypothetical protein
MVQDLAAEEAAEDLAAEDPNPCYISHFSIFLSKVQKCTLPNITIK